MSIEADVPATFTGHVELEATVIPIEQLVYFHGSALSVLPSC
jgi:hypothetical protein